VHLCTHKPPLSHGNTLGAYYSNTMCNLRLYSANIIIEPFTPKRQKEWHQRDRACRAHFGRWREPQHPAARRCRKFKRDGRAKYDPRMQVKLEEVWDLRLVPARHEYELRKGEGEKAVLRDAAVAAACSSDLTASDTNAASTSAVSTSRTWHAQSAVRGTSRLTGAGPWCYFSTSSVWPPRAP